MHGIRHTECFTKAGTVLAEVNMTKSDNEPQQEQLEEHSLPGMNQAGRGPGRCAEDDSVEERADAEARPRPAPDSHGRPDK